MTPVAILLVEDDEILLTLLKTSLEAFFCTVSTAPDAGVAIQLLEQKKFDLVLTDLQLGASSGLDVIRRTKTLLPKSVIFMMSACSDIRNIQAAYLSGADDYLLKPFTIGFLLERLCKKGLQLQQAIQFRVQAKPQNRVGFCQNTLHPDKGVLYT